MIFRFASSAKFLFDSFTIAMVLAFLDNGASLPPAFLWLAASFLISGAAFLVFNKIPYHAGVSAVIAFCGLGTALLFGLPLWLAVVLGLISAFLLHTRFSASDYSTEQDGNTLLLWFLVFSAVLFIDLLSMRYDASMKIYPIMFAAISFYVLFHLLNRFFLSRTGGTKPWQVAVSGGAVLSLSALIAFLVYELGPGARTLTGAAAGWLLQLFLWPFSPLMEKAADFFSGLSQSQEATDTFNKLAPPGASEEIRQSVTTSSYSGFPTELFLIAGAVLLLIVLIVYMRRTKSEKPSAVPETRMEEVRSMPSERQGDVETGQAVQYSEMDLEVIRRSYRQFEQQAKNAGVGRRPHETVREWISRMGWSASEAFFQTYDLVRYGAGNVPEQDALPFLAEIKQIKEKYFHEQV